MSDEKREAAAPSVERPEQRAHPLICQHRLLRVDERCYHGLAFGTTCEGCIRTCALCWDLYSSASTYGPRPATPDPASASQGGAETQDKKAFDVWVKLGTALTTAEEFLLDKAVDAAKVRLAEALGLYDRLNDLDVFASPLSREDHAALIAEIEAELAPEFGFQVKANLADLLHRALVALRGAR